MITEYILRLSVAALLGAVIGLDREYRAKDAGFRTHFLVALGSALFMVLSQYGFEQAIMGHEKVSFDPSRIASQVVTGIGFIGAGTIILQKKIVRGLTTAAGLWVTSAIGLACGAGMYIIAAATTVLALICLEAFNTILKHIGKRNVNVKLTASTQSAAHQVLKDMEAAGVEIETCSIQEGKSREREACVINLMVRIKEDNYITILTEIISHTNGVYINEIE